MTYTYSNSINELFTEIEKLTLKNTLLFANSYMSHRAGALSGKDYWQIPAFTLESFRSFSGPGVDAYHIYPGEVCDMLMQKKIRLKVTKEFYDKTLAEYTNAKTLYAETAEAIRLDIDANKAAFYNTNIPESVYFENARLRSNLTEFMRKFVRRITEMDEIIAFINYLVVDEEANLNTPLMSVFRF